MLELTNLLSNRIGAWVRPTCAPFRIHRQQMPSFGAVREATSRARHADVRPLTLALSLKGRGKSRGPTTLSLPPPGGLERWSHAQKPYNAKRNLTTNFPRTSTGRGWQGSTPFLFSLVQEEGSGLPRESRRRGHRDLASRCGAQSAGRGLFEAGFAPPR